MHPSTNISSLEINFGDIKARELKIPGTRFEKPGRFCGKWTIAFWLFSPRADLHSIVLNSRKVIMWLISYRIVSASSFLSQIHWIYKVECLRKWFLQKSFVVDFLYKPYPCLACKMLVSVLERAFRVVSLHCVLVTNCLLVWLAKKLWKKRINQVKFLPTINSKPVYSPSVSRYFSNCKVIGTFFFL